MRASASSRNCFPGFSACLSKAVPQPGASSAAWGWGSRSADRSSNSTGVTSRFAAKALGKGATLTVEFPAIKAFISRSTQPSPPPDTAISDRCLKILMVEDNKDTLNYFSQMLIQRGHVVRTASSLAMALRMAAPEADFELLVSDIELPDGSGLELMGKLRSQGASGVLHCRASDHPTTSNRAAPRDFRSTSSSLSNFGTWSRRFSASRPPTRSRHTSPKRERGEMKKYSSIPRSSVGLVCCSYRGHIGIGYGTRQGRSA